MPETTGLRSGLTDYGDVGFSEFLRKAFIKGAGYTDEALDRPVVGIINTSSGFNPCHGNVDQLIDAVSRGVMLNGALPIAFPTISIHESFSQPTSMFLRNLMSMDTEEMIRAQPMDAVVLIGGCDKTVPAQLMGAASAGIPAIQLVTGPMLSGGHRGAVVGACTDCRSFWGKYRAEEIDKEEIEEVNSRLVGSVGTCTVMGTASTMACVAEAMGAALPGSATAPAVTADRMRIAEQTGKRAVELASEGLTLDKVVTAEGITNAFRVVHAIGGSTNAVVHLAAIAGRLGYSLDLEAIDDIGRETPVLVDLKPSGQGYMEDFHRAGGLPAVMRQIRHLLKTDALTVTGRSLGEELDDAHDSYDEQIVRSLDNPVSTTGGIAVLRGNLAPAGALLKASAASGELIEHTGRVVVFENSKDMAERIDSDDLDVNADDIIVLKNIGPVGAPGMPEAGYIPIPLKLARAGVKDMVRISDGRMSGTAFGTIVLHVSPESAVGGPLGAVRTGDNIRLSLSERSIELLVSDEEISARLSDNVPHMVPGAERGYRKLYVDEVTQAEEGLDFRFLQGLDKRGAAPLSS
ncbi:IlvD/Edd family dehydratase [Brevibacterium aurantiacum]|uniref:Dihydroxy-acid dehydratase n=1 Tax=Brevibacterium aurantiacum TaxID=273384 RepID=A0A2H1KN93_BREAU|nr:IlvD/Edd family dehydratase [Brevibacterium aurantiacum]SMY01217.1 dihydroxy-acid dehydratase [Brevibacterium aurantiacum]